MKFLLSYVLVCIAGITYAEHEKQPYGCSPMAVQGATLKVSAEKPLLVMIHNISPSTLWITHPVSTGDTKAGWSSELTPNKWSALTLDQLDFELSCIESKPGHEQQIPCQSAISVCLIQLENPSEPLKGTYWAGENQALTNLTTHLGDRGFKLPTPSQ